MNTEEFRPLKELESDLREYQQAYAFGDIEKPEFERAEASLTAAITARKLVIAKNAAARKLDALKAAGQIDRVAWTRATTAIADAKNEAELNAIQPQKLAA